MVDVTTSGEPQHTSIQHHHTPSRAFETVAEDASAFAGTPLLEQDVGQNDGRFRTVRTQPQSARRTATIDKLRYQFRCEASLALPQKSVKAGVFPAFVIPKNRTRDVGHRRHLLSSPLVDALPRPGSIGRVCSMRTTYATTKFELECKLEECSIHGNPLFLTLRSP